MANPQTMMSNQKIPVGVTIVDEGGEIFEALPPGYVVTIESSDPSIVGVAMRPDGMNADLTSDNIGTAQIRIKTVKPDGTLLGGFEDVTDVTVAHAAPNSQNITFGAPEPE